MEQYSSNSSGLFPIEPVYEEHSAFVSPPALICRRVLYHATPSHEYKIAVSSSRFKKDEFELLSVVLCWLTFDLFVTAFVVDAVAY